MKALLAVGMVGAFGVLIYDETLGGQWLSRTLRGEGGIDLSQVKEHSRLIALLALVLFITYLIDEKLSLMLAGLILVSILLTRRD